MAKNRLLVTSARKYEPIEFETGFVANALSTSVRFAAIAGGAAGRGVVVLPTGTGKTFLQGLSNRWAVLPAFALAVTLTIDLLHQWHDELTNRVQYSHWARKGVHQ